MTQPNDTPDSPDATAVDLGNADIVVVGAGAAGLMAAIQAARAAPEADVRIVDGQTSLGAKILISGGGRCNVTHHEVTAAAFAGSTQPSIRKVLRAFDVRAVRAFFEDLGVPLVREATGKLFPESNRARTVLEALLAAAGQASVKIQHPFRVATITPLPEGGFELAGPHGRLGTVQVILATGGRSVIETGSDGHGYVLAQALGHTVTRTWPALVPLTLPPEHPLTALKGISLEARIEVRAASGKRRVQMEGPVLCTHFGLSGPAIMDISRYWLDISRREPGTRLIISWRPAYNREQVDRWLQRVHGKVADALGETDPQRFVALLLRLAGLPANIQGHALRKGQRQALVALLCEMELPIVDHRGWRFAEVTAGGVPLSELRADSLASRQCPGLSLCGEIVDVDGRIGGFNFHWAWASGTLAGRGAAAAWLSVSKAPADDPGS